MSENFPGAEIHGDKEAMQGLRKCGGTQRWIVFVACCVRVFFVSGSLKANGVILDELVLKLNSNHVLVAWAFSIQHACYYLISPVTQMLMDTFSYRQLSVAGGFLVGAGYILSGLFAENVWQIFVTYSLSGFGFGLQSITSYLCLKEHFPENFSMITSMTTLFHFVGMAILPSVLNWFKSEYGLENSLILLGGVMWNLVPFGVGTISPKRTNYLAITEEEEMENEAQENKLHEELDDGKTEAFIKKWFPLLLPWYHHVNFRYMHILSITGMFIYTSWVIFLVSLGTSLGLPTEQAVLLSTFGGIGGFSGRLLAAALFYLDKVNAEVCCLPLLLTAASMMSVIFMKHYSMIATLTLISGVSQGLTTTLLYGLIPHIVCSHHFPSALSLVLVSEGVTIQLSGLFSGFLHDALGSTVYVFAFNAVLSAVVVPFMVPWSWNDQAVKECKGI